MSSGPSTSTQLPLNIGIAPFPEGFQGDMDETFQQACLLMEAFIQGNFLTGLILPPGSTLPTTDQGPIAMGGVWYFYNTTTGSYQPQTVPTKPAKNFAKNAIYQISQAGNWTPSAPLVITSPTTRHFDMAQSRVTANQVLSVYVEPGPPASADTDFIGTAINYIVGPTTITTPAAGDFFAHEHLIEGADLLPLQGEPLSLGFSVYTTTPGTYSAYLASSGRDESYTANFNVPTANTWTRIKIQGIPPLPTGGTWHFSEGVTGLYVGIAFAVGSQYQTTTPNQWVSGFFGGTSSNNTMLGSVNNQMYITGLKLEASASCTPLSVNSFDTDYTDCIRYYWTSFTYQSTTSGVALSWAAYIVNGCLFSYVFPRRMAKAPTVTFYSWTTPAAGFVTNISTGPNQAVAAFGGYAKGFVVNPAGLTSAKGDVYLAYITADARLS